MFTTKTGLIIPTRNRPNNLYSTLKYLRTNKINFFKIVVVDSSDKILKKNILNICNEFKVSIFFSKPSTSGQRNLGLKKLSGNKLQFVMFLDDDLKFYKNSFKVMDLNIKKNKEKYIGFVFNNTQLNEKKSFLERIKVSKFVESIGFYSSRPGRVLDNGWQTKISNLKKNLDSQWAPTAAIVLKKNILKGKNFEKSFGNYSYLEDLDFSLQLNHKRNNLFLVVSNARFVHLKEIARTSFVFGYYEFANRYKIVKKFHLSKLQFFLMAVVKMFLTVFSIVVNYKNIFKLMGNVVGIIACALFMQTKK
jgi:glycosyltransferase involved in cell wall biosynthesis